MRTIFPLRSGSRRRTTVIRLIAITSRQVGPDEMVRARSDLVMSTET